jgi:hypothetical protein
MSIRAGRSRVSIPEQCVARQISTETSLGDGDEFLSRPRLNGESRDKQPVMGAQSKKKSKYLLRKPNIYAGSIHLGFDTVFIY